MVKQLNWLCSAEFMFDVISTGAAVTPDRDWHELNYLLLFPSYADDLFYRNEVWKSTEEAASVYNEIEGIHVDGRGRPIVGATRTVKFATSWFNQLRCLLHRQWLAYWREPSYIMSKLVLNILAGLFIGVRLFWFVSWHHLTTTFRLLYSSLSSKKPILSRER